MTKITKKQNNAVQEREPSPASSTENPTVKELREKNAELERRLRKYKKKNKTTRTTIKPLIRPAGEAGSRKRGFILFEAMQMAKVENGSIMYDRMRDSVRKACVKVGLDFGAHYRHQDHEKLGQVFLLVRKSFPYLSTERFPHNWAIADMVKGYIAGTRKERRRQAREEEQDRKRDTAHMKTKKRARDSDSDSEPSGDEDQATDEVPLAVSSQKTVSGTSSSTGKSTNSKRSKPSVLTASSSWSSSSKEAKSTKRPTAHQVDSDCDRPPTKRQTTTPITKSRAGGKGKQRAEERDSDVEYDDANGDNGDNDDEEEDAE